MFAFRFIGRHFRKVHAFHQAVHSADADVNAIIALENELYFVGSEAFVIIGVDMKDKAFETLVFRYARSGSAAEMLIKGTSVDVKHTAKGFDVMLKAKPVYGV